MTDRIEKTVQLLQTAIGLAGTSGLDRDLVNTIQLTEFTHGMTVTQMRPILRVMERRLRDHVCTQVRAYIELKQEAAALV